MGRVHSVMPALSMCYPWRALADLTGRGHVTGALGLALATDVAALGHACPLGRSWSRISRLPGDPQQRSVCGVPGRPRLGRPGVGAAWTNPSVLAGRAHGRLPGSAATPWARSDAVAAGPRAWADGPLCHLCRSLHGAGTAVCRAERQAFAVPTLLTLVQALVGLGEGLTPSGDDFLVGLLAVLHMTGFLPCSAGSPVQAQFCQCVRLGTSQLSGEFLRCAFEGHFAEPLVMLVRPCAPATDAWPAHAALATVGHSSGVDAMVGIALGCRLLT